MTVEKIEYLSGPDACSEFWDSTRSDEFRYSHGSYSGCHNTHVYESDTHWLFETMHERDSNDTNIEIVPKLPEPEDK